MKKIILTFDELLESNINSFRFNGRKTRDGITSKYDQDDDMDIESVMDYILYSDIVEFTEEEIEAKLEKMKKHKTINFAPYGNITGIMITRIK